MRRSRWTHKQRVTSMRTAPGAPMSPTALMRRVRHTGSVDSQGLQAQHGEMVHSSLTPPCLSPQSSHPIPTPNGIRDNQTSSQLHDTTASTPAESIILRSDISLLRRKARTPSRSPDSIVNATLSPEGDVSSRGVTPPEAVLDGRNARGNEVSRALDGSIACTPDILSQQSSTSPAGAQISHSGVSLSGHSGRARSRRSQALREARQPIISRTNPLEGEHTSKRLFVATEEERNARRKMETELLAEAGSRQSSQQSGTGNIVQNTGTQAELVRSPNEKVHPTKLTYQFRPFGEGSTVQTLSRDQGGHKRNVFDVDSDDKEHDTSLRAKLRRKRDNEESALASEHDTTPDRQEMPPASSMDQHFRRTNMLMSLSLPSTINGVTSQIQSVLGTSSNTSHRRTHGHHVMFRSQNSIQTRNFEKMCARGDLCLGAEGHQELTIDHNDHRQYCYYAKTQKGARGPSRARTP